MYRGRKPFIGTCNVVHCTHPCVPLLGSKISSHSGERDLLSAMHPPVCCNSKSQVGTYAYYKSTMLQKLCKKHQDFVKSSLSN